MGICIVTLAWVQLSGLFWCSGLAYSGSRLLWVAWTLWVAQDWASLACYALSCGVLPYSELLWAVLACSGQFLAEVSGLFWEA